MMEFMYLPFTRMPGESYHRGNWCLLCLCDVCPGLTNSLLFADVGRSEQHNKIMFPAMHDYTFVKRVFVTIMSECIATNHLTFNPLISSNYISDPKILISLGSLFLTRCLILLLTKCEEIRQFISQRFFFSLVHYPDFVFVVLFCLLERLES